MKLANKSSVLCTFSIKFVVMDSFIIWMTDRKTFFIHSGSVNFFFMGE